MNSGRSIPLPLSAAPAEGRAARPPAVAGVTPQMIADIVDDFYSRCRKHDVLGPIFNHHVKDWDEHLARIRAFWSSVMLRTGEYAGRPLEAHRSIPNLSTDHFSIWLRLFRETVVEHCPPHVAEAYMDFAGKMARTMITLGGIPRSSGCPVTNHARDSR